MPWSAAYGLLHEYFARRSELDAKQPVGNYIIGRTKNGYALSWDGQLHAWIDQTYLGALWYSGNFDPNAKADIAYVNARLDGKTDTT